MKRLLAPTLVLCLVATGASCGSEDKRSDPPAPTTTSPATTEPEPTDEEQLEELADGWFEAAPGLSGVGGDLTTAEDYLVGEYLESFRADAEARVDDGLKAEPDPAGRSSTKIEGIVVNGATAVVTECIVDGDVLVNAEDGSVLDDSVSATRFETEAVRTADGWRFSRRTSIDSWEEQTTCAES